MPTGKAGKCLDQKGAPKEGRFKKVHSNDNMKHPLIYCNDMSGNPDKILALIRTIDLV